MERKELLKSKEYWLTEIQLNLFNIIEDYRKQKNINRTELAAELGVTKGYISQVLNGNFDHKISKLVELSLAFNKVPILSYLDMDKYIKDDAANLPHYLDNKHIPKEIQYNIYKDGVIEVSGTEPVKKNTSDKAATVFSKLISTTDY